MRVQIKVCSRCRLEKPLEFFDLRSDRPGKRRSHCADCRRKQVKDYDSKNKDKKSLYNKDYRDKNKEDLTKKAKIYYKQNRKERLAYLKLWRASNPDKVSMLGRLRRENLRYASPSWLTEEQMGQIKEIYILAKDCSVTSGEIYEVDHIVPLKGKNVCGLHVPWNLQVLPKDLNRAKSNRHD